MLGIKKQLIRLDSLFEVGILFRSIDVIMVGLLYGKEKGRAWSKSCVRIGGLAAFVAALGC